MKVMLLATDGKVTNAAPASTAPVTLRIRHRSTIKGAAMARNTTAITPLRPGALHWENQCAEASPSHLPI